MLITKPKRGIRLNVLHPLSKGLVGCWLFNEGSGQKYYDLSLYGNHGTQSTKAYAPKWTSGKFGKGLKLDGSDDFLNCGYDASLNITNAITFEVWVNPDGFASYNYIFAKRTGSDAQWSLFLGWSQLKIGWYDGAWKMRATAAGTISATGWQHVVFTWDGATSMIYIDGISKTHTGDSISFLPYPSSPLKIGQNGVGTAGRYFNGRMDYFRIYNRALSPSEIKYSYRHPFAMFEFGDDMPDMIPFRYHTFSIAKELELWKDRIE